VQKNWSHIVKRVALLLIVPAIVCAFVGANLLNKNNVCKSVIVHVKNEEIVKFVTPTEITSALVNANNIVLGSTKIKDIQVANLEAIVQNNAWVADANIYVDHNENINVDVLQKEPILRWLNGDVVQNYLDASANAIPVNPNHTANVPVVTSANIGATIATQKLKYKMVALCNYIKKDTFWNAAIAQININNHMQFELITNLGDHLVLFGDTTNMQNKFARLATFYKEAMPRNGWDVFTQLDVRYDGQIVAQKLDSVQLKIARANKQKNIIDLKKPSVINTNAAIVAGAVLAKVASVKPKAKNKIIQKIEANKNKVKLIIAKPKVQDKVLQAKNNLKSLLANKKIITKKAEIKQKPKPSKLPLIKK
jgi:cell division protein FtsQ